MGTSAPAISIVGYLNIDVNKYPDKEEILPGGAAYFVSLAASLLNPSVALVSTVGTDFPLETLENRVRLDGTLKVDIPASKSVQIYTDPNDLSKRTVDLFDGAAQLLQPEDIPEDWLHKSKWLHIATMPPTIQQKFIEYVRSKEVTIPVSIDTDISFLKKPEYVPIIDSMFKRADYVFMNRYEWEALQRSFSQYKTVVVKKDADGAELFKEGKSISTCPAPKVQCVDATGAGDVFAGTFIAEMVNGKTEHDAMCQAVGQASKSIEQLGILHLLQ